MLVVRFTVAFTAFFFAIVAALYLFSFFDAVMLARHQNPPTNAAEISTGYALLLGFLGFGVSLSGYALWHEANPPSVRSFATWFSLFLAALTLRFWPEKAILAMQSQILALAHQHPWEIWLGLFLIPLTSRIIMAMLVYYVAKRRIGQMLAHLLALDRAEP